MKTTKHTVKNNKTNAIHTFYMNKPSAYLECLMADPLKSKQLSALPDYTNHRVNNMQQGSKWRTHPLLQRPMIHHNGIDIWVGNVGGFVIKNKLTLILISQFYQLQSRDSDNYENYVRGYKVVPVLNDSENYSISYDNNGDYNYSGIQHLAISSDETADIPLSTYLGLFEKLAITSCPVRYSVAATSASSIVFTASSTDDIQGKLWSDTFHCVERYKRKKPDGKSLMKVVNVPLTLWSDETSGNQSKQYNLYSMTVLP